MQTLKHKSRGQSVYFLEEILHKIGYDSLNINQYFDLQTDSAVKNFQSKNRLVVDGIVGPKTWSVLLKTEQEFLSHNDKFLSEEDLQAFAKHYNLELAAVKAVNAVESNGKGFLIDGRPKILFEGHIFWKELQKRGLNPNEFHNSFTQNVLYSKWTKRHYIGGNREFHRLEKAAGISDLQAVHDAAYSSASWGAFQIMGFHATDLGYSSVDSFVASMYEHEREHLKAFGLYLERNNLIRYIKDKNWAKFARGYNGSSYAKNKYDVKLQTAYEKFLK